MNKIIEKQLKKTLVADLTNFDPKTNTYNIPKFNQLKLEVDHCYIVKLDPFLLDINQCRLLASNFNRNSVPTNEYMKVEVCKTMGRMIYVDGVGYDNENQTDLKTFWSGWLTLDNLTVVDKVV